MQTWEINAPAPGLRWLFPTQVAAAKAGALQGSVIIGEADSFTDTNPEAVAIATIHGRQDIVLLVSLLQANHAQLVKISRGIWAVAICIFLLVFSR